MSIITASVLNSYQQFIQPDLFSLLVNQDTAHTEITMSLFVPIVSTRSLPSTYTILRQTLPSIYKSRCFNEANLPFAQEVLRTEIGHLFEHILLEYLCLYKLDKGSSSAIFNGETSWNWKRDPYGTFHITIDAGVNDNNIFQEALTASITLFNKILNKSN